jgi:hypothetical protein
VRALDLDPDLVAWLAVAALGLAAVAALLALVALARVSRLRRAWRALGIDPRAGDDLVSAIGRQRADLGRMRAAVEGARGELDELRADVAAALRHVAVVRYDAFGDMGGRMSFSAALLDDNGDGVVLTSISGRSDTRTYAKGVKAGTSETQMSPEEQQAVDHAMRPRTPGDLGHTQRS